MYKQLIDIENNIAIVKILQNSITFALNETFDVILENTSSYHD